MTNYQEILYLGQHIKRIRKEYKLSQMEMARKLHVCVHTLSKIEKGILPPRMSCEFLFNIENQFGIHPKDLFKPCPPP